MLNKIRVLLIDDSVVVRKMVSNLLSTDPLIEIAGTAANGLIGLARIEQTNPDLVLMDVEMPQLNGLETLRELRKRRPELPVIMFSVQTERGAVATLDALAMGANDYVHKPLTGHERSATRPCVGETLLPKIKALVGKKIRNQQLATHNSPLLSVTGGENTSSSDSEFDLFSHPDKPMFREWIVPRILVLGVSTGGPNALQTLFRALPGTFPIPILVVQHMPPIFTRLLAQRLNTHSALQVREAEEGIEPRAGEVWIAPGNYHLTLALDKMKKPRLKLDQNPPQNSCRPAVDPLFQSAVNCFGSSVVGVVMTGMGRDGLLGSRAIKSAGGRILVQDEASSVVWGMPGYVAAEDLADGIVPLSQLANEMLMSATPIHTKLFNSSRIQSISPMIALEGV